MGLALRVGSMPTFAGLAAAAWFTGFCVLVYGLWLAEMALPGFPHAVNVATHMPFLLDKPVGEDGFYMLAVAWQAALGKGLVGNFDQPVTGIQPLATLLYAGVAKLVHAAGGDKQHFVRAVMVFGALNFMLFAHQMGLIAQRLVPAGAARQRAHVLAVLATLLSFHTFRVFTYGLETGVYLTVLAQLVLMSFTYFAQRPASPWHTQNLTMGVAVGVAGLARVDFVLVFGLFALVAMRNLRGHFPSLCVVGLIAALVFAPWPLHVWQVSGSPIPSSGPAQAELISLASLGERLSAMANALIQNLLPVVFTNGRWDAGVLALVLIVAFMLWRKPSPDRLENRVMQAWLATFLMLASVYVILIWATHFYARYTAPLMVAAMPMTAAQLSLRFEGRRSDQKVLVALLASSLAFAASTVFVLHRGKLGNPHVLSAGFVHDHFAKVGKVGAFQSGVVGFANDNVINLDGKVNIEVLPYVKRGNIDAYLMAHPEIEVIVDWPSYIHTYISDAHLASQWQPCAHPIPEHFSVCYVRRGAQLHG
ncbi:MAG: hypothetical protein RI907_2657 [Pseudomonadota bacterium]|jgi:hypothetical protein